MKIPLDLSGRCVSVPSTGFFEPLLITKALVVKQFWTPSKGTRDAGGLT
jgi:hypothetical protein